jgi:hypothetical protein
METQKSNVGTFSPRAKVWWSLLPSTLASLFGLISSLISVASLLRLPLAIVIAVGAALITAGFTFVLVKRERGPSRVVELKDSIAAAYINALEGSPLNPANGVRR